VMAWFVGSRVMKRFGYQAGFVSFTTSRKRGGCDEDTHADVISTNSLHAGNSVAALYQGAPGQTTWLEDPPPWLRPA